MTGNDFQKNYSKIIAKAWSNPQFKEQLRKDPEGVLKAEGIEIPKGVKLTLCENTDTQFYFVLPNKPAGELTEKQLESVAGGVCAFSAHICEQGLCKFDGK